MNIFHQILSERIIVSLGWTILHSLWQGVLVGIMLAALLYQFRRHSARLRYNLSVVSLLFIFIFSLLTFAFIYSGSGNIVENEVSRINSGLTTYQSIATYLSNDFIKTPVPEHSISVNILPFINDQFPLIVGLWLIGVFVAAFRLAGGYFMNTRYKRAYCNRLPQKFESIFEDLKRAFNIRRCVQVFESNLVKTPMLIGYFKPVILVPLNIVTHIPCEQIEAILAHELAHIKRHDFLVNIIQAVIEALMFYHPAIWMINRVIRKERENCCDDLALSVSSNTLNYVKALANIHAIPFKSDSLVMAMGTDRYHLLNRVIRIIKKRKMKTNLIDKLIAGSILISAGLVILLNTGATFRTESPGQQALINLPGVEYMNPDSELNVSDVERAVEVNNNITPAPNVQVDPNIDLDVLPAPEIHFAEYPDTSLKVKDNTITRTFIRGDEEMNIKMVVKKGKVTELYVNGEEIPEEDYDKYQDEIDKTLDDIRDIEEDLREAREDLEDFDVEELKLEIEESMKETLEDIDIDMDEIRRELENMEFPEIDFEEIQIEMEKALTELKEIDLEEVRKEMEIAMEEARKAFEEMDWDSEKFQLEMEKKIEMQEIDMEQIEEDIQKAMEEIEINKEQWKEDMEKYMQDKEEMMEKIKNSLEEMELFNEYDFKAEMERAMKDIEDADIDIEEGKKEIDEMIKEIEKLELEEEK